MTVPPSAAPDDDLPWVVWNGTAGLVSTAALGRIEHRAGGAWAWLAPPFEMVGPFDLQALQRDGCIGFAACQVMSREHWRRDQDSLRAAARQARQAARARAGRAGFDGTAPAPSLTADDERRHRHTLELPGDGALAVRQIRGAFRRLAQRAHPDVGGSHEAFIALKAARDALLAAHG